MTNKQHQGQSNKTEGDTLVLDRLADRNPSDFDPAEYLPDMEEFDLSEEQATELLTTLWEIMKAFVDLGFGVDSIHRIFPELVGVSGELEADQVDSKDDHLTDTFDQAASSDAEQKKDS